MFFSKKNAQNRNFSSLEIQKFRFRLAAVPLHWIQKSYTSADDDGIARLKQNHQRKYSDPDFQKVDAKMTKINAKFMIFNEILSKNHRLDVYRNLDFELDGKDFPA